MSALSSFPLFCELDTNCNKVTCCVEAELTNSTFQVNMDIDPCTRTLSLGVGNLQAIIPFTDLSWGMREEILKKKIYIMLSNVWLISLMGVFKSKYWVKVLLNLLYNLSNYENYDITHSSTSRWKSHFLMSQCINTVLINRSYRQINKTKYTFDLSWSICSIRWRTEILPVWINTHRVSWLIYFHFYPTYFCSM